MPVTPAVGALVMLMETPTINTRFAVAVVVWAKVRFEVPVIVAVEDVVASTATCAHKYGVDSSPSTRLNAPRKESDLVRAGADPAARNDFDIATFKTFD